MERRISLSEILEILGDKMEKHKIMKYECLHYSGVEQLARNPSFSSFQIILPLKNNQTKPEIWSGTMCADLGVPDPSQGFYREPQRMESEAFSGTFRPSGANY